MNNDELFYKICSDLTAKIDFLEDKPEETAESTLKALWHTAAGTPVSATNALKLSIPELSDNQIQKLHQLVELRLNNTPLAYITKRQNFMGVELLVDTRALIPRKETELLGQKALELSDLIGKHKNPVTVIDVCCGSGNLGIAIANNNPRCKVYATDLSQEAVDLTQENIDLLKLNHRMYVKQGDLLSGFENDEFYNKVDLIVCNPPYIISSKVGKMNKEISSNEPVLAFDGGMLGISIIQKLLREAPKFLTPEGWIIFEVGAGQGNLISQLCKKNNSFENIDTVTDNSGTIRVILAQKSKNIN